MSVKQELLILQLLAQSCGEHSGEGDCRVIRHKFMSVYEEACDWAVEQGFADYTDDGVQLKDDPFESVDLEQRAKTSPGFWGRACARLTTKNAALLERCEKMERARPVLNVVNRKRLKTLEKRLAYLADRIQDCAKKGIEPGFDKAEHSAISWAIECIVGPATLASKEEPSV